MRLQETPPILGSVVVTQAEGSGGADHPVMAYRSRRLRVSRPARRRRGDRMVGKVQLRIDLGDGGPHCGSHHRGRRGGGGRGGFVVPPPPLWLSLLLFRLSPC